MTIYSTGSILRAISAGVALTLLAQTPAEARRVVINDPWPEQEIGNCAAIDGGCTLESLPFQVWIGGEAFGSVVVYDDGLVSFGAPVDFFALESAQPVDQWGAPVAVTSLQMIDFIGYPMIFSEISSTSTSFTVQWYDGFFTPEAGYLGPDTGGPYDVTFTRGNDLQTLTLSLLDNGDVQLDVAFVPQGTDTGYALGDDVLPLNPNLVGYTVLLPAPDSVVPEPATWAMMILGFGLVGSALRRRVLLPA